MKNNEMYGVHGTTFGTPIEVVPWNFHLLWEFQVELTEEEGGSLVIYCCCVKELYCRCFVLLLVAHSRFRS